MENINDFYNSILNIRDIDYSDKIKSIVLQEKRKLESKITDTTGFCKYIASQIENKLRDLNIKTYWINLNIYGIDHVILISEYKHNNKMVRILIDPTYIQFTKMENKKLINLPNWPSELIDKNILSKLLQFGCIEINNDIFNNYLKAFNCNQTINLDDFLMDYQLNKKSL